MEFRVLMERDAEAFWAATAGGPGERTARLRPVGRGASDDDDRRIAGPAPFELREASFVMGAFAGGKLIGSAGLNRNQYAKQRHKGHIWGVYLAEKWRRKGIGLALLKALLDLARAQPGLEQINLTVNSGQAAAKQLYSALGFECFGHERHALKSANLCRRRLHGPHTIMVIPRN